MPLTHPLPGEKVVTIIRRHWIIFLVSALLDLVLLLVPLPVLWFLETYFPLLFTHTSSWWALIVLLTSLYILFMLLLAYVHFVDLYLDVWIVTDRRVVSIEQRGMFSRTEAEHVFNKIQDITVEVSGILATFFNFGNLHVQTAGERERFTFRHAPEPYLLKNTITSLIESQQGSR